MRLPVALPLLLALAAGGLVALAAAPRPAAACSCLTGYARGDVLPRDGERDVDPRTTIQLRIGGFAAPGREDTVRASYRLTAAGGAEVALAHRCVGTLVILTPRQALAPRTRYELRASDGYGRQVVVTRFTTAARRALPDPGLTPVIGAITHRPGSDRQPGRCWYSASSAVEVGPLAVTAGQAALFTWELEDETPTGWTPLQASPVAEWGLPPAPPPSRRPGPPARPAAAVLRPVKVLGLGASQCSAGPVLSPGPHRLRLVLVRADGRRWASAVRAVTAP